MDVLLQNATPTDIEYLERNLPVLVRLAGVTAPRVLDAGQSAPIAAVALLGRLEILVPMAGLIEPKAELDRLAKRRRKVETERTKLAAKLANLEFVRNAPAEVIAKDRTRLSELLTEAGQLDAQAARVEALQTR